MPVHRFKALEKVFDRQPRKVELPSTYISDFFGDHVFNEETMRVYLSDEGFKSVKRAIEKGDRIGRHLADQIAGGMKAWALSKGATHYTHWFQPLTGRTAEKHDAFFEPLQGGRSIEKFDGEQLVQQEPDASSFPSGGIRNTFEARGYTAWDPTSPAFVFDRTLCIPTIFISYTGEALDYKTPVLRSIKALDEAATSVMHYFDRNVKKVQATLGWEQEYFLVDDALYNARPDLVLCGRTVFGHSSSKGQQLDDHYFGSIPDRAVAFMREFEMESLRLGIPVKTRHNEVAPNQFECAPLYEEANLSIDHNQLVMDVMEKVARRHNFRVLLHEKPFESMNGSGKHNNWSMATDSGINLLSPGKNPKSNLRFVTFLVNVLKAVHDYSDLLRASIATAGNDYRLGANEAPPAIISVFIGSQLTALLDEIEHSIKGSKLSPAQKTELKLNIGKIPEIMRDNTDRNRTSPFAFTGNKFEFRAVGSSSNCASAMIVLNTIVASTLKGFKKDVDVQISKGLKKDVAILLVLREYIAGSKAIRFEGNGYSEEWEKEAASRKLSNIHTTPEALEVYLAKQSTDLFAQMDVLSGRELEARTEIAWENYWMKIQIESRIMADLSISHVLPAAVKSQKNLIDLVIGMREVMDDWESSSTTQRHLINEISEHINEIHRLVNEMIDERRKANKLKRARDKAINYCHKVKPYFDLIRTHVDALEQVISNDAWPLPKYREMLFTR